MDIPVSGFIAYRIQVELWRSKPASIQEVSDLSYAIEIEQ